MTSSIEEIGNKPSRHCYPGTDILKNKKGIKNKEELDKEEKILTAYKLAILASGDYSNITQTWDYNHYLSIHRFLFEELYDFAGKTRDEKISKGTYFCFPLEVDRELKEVLRMMDYNVKKVVDKDWLTSFLGQFFVKLNRIHPFREGNGRTSREFMREYVERFNKENGLNYELNYQLVTPSLKQKYLYASMNFDSDIMKEVFDALVIEKEYEHEKGIHR